MTTTPIEIALFDFIDELADSLRKGDIAREDPLDTDSEALTFCESFFDQFFGGLGHSITGFSRKAKRAAAEIAERLRVEDEESSKQTRRVIVLFEEFCDMYSDISGNYDASSVDYELFHVDYLSRLLSVAADWATSQKLTPLADRITTSRSAYMEAVEESEWLTKRTKRESAWQKLISRVRMSS